ncbi:hypothetical protein BU23DRAFT_17612 [Bimuria novae-zelandiae CBS 107.79]|uniref:Uncharacterized protein n=1 Tax=Bimuria novae-zelandiae CBS 107.79 TaxID=1447943 RepID=A0A6A5ULQ3_9PLEO|nr:hypothetical protein BU23DRAFT_17612 [Bimuria novae-zelandiae CBS 107.79]
MCRTRNYLPERCSAAFNVVCTIFSCGDATDGAHCRNQSDGSRMAKPPKRHLDDTVRFARFSIHCCMRGLCTTPFCRYDTRCRRKSCTSSCAPSPVLSQTKLPAILQRTQSAVNIINHKDIQRRRNMRSLVPPAP